MPSIKAWFVTAARSAVALIAASVVFASQPVSVGDVRGALQGVEQVAVGQETSETSGPSASTKVQDEAHQPAGSLTVVLDPGHGGGEMGAEGKTGVLEKEITLDIAKRLKTILASETGINVLLTRDADSPVDLDERTALANQNHADLFLSIHVNASPRPGARGAETYFLSYQFKDEEIRKLAAIENNAAGVDRESLREAPEGLELVLWDLAQAQHLEESSALAGIIQKELNEATGVKDRGVKQAPFRVLMGATMAAVLVEVGFLSNQEEEANLKTDEYRNRIAEALSRAVIAFRSDAARRLVGSAARSH